MFIFGQSYSQVNINFSIGGLTSDTIYFGKIAGKKQVRISPLTKNSAGTYDLKLEKNLEPGFYSIIYELENSNKSKSNYYFQFAVDDKNKNYSLHCEANNPFSTLKVTGEEGAETNRYFEYLNNVDTFFTAYNFAIEKWITTENDKYFSGVINREAGVNEMQKAFLKKYPNTLTAKFIELTRLNFPTYTGTINEMKIQRQQFFDKEYLKGFDAKPELMFMSKAGIDWLDLYTLRSSNRGDVPKATERATKILEQLILQRKPMYEYYLNYLLNSYPKLTTFGIDGTMLTMHKAYIDSGKAPHIKSEDLTRFKTIADNIERLQVGKTLPDVRLYKQDLSPYNFTDTKTKYSLIMFWSPDCGHCKKELPLIRSLGDKMKNIGIQVHTVCAKRGEQTPSCYDYLKKENYPLDWINLGDPQNLSRFTTIYDITSFPVIYLIKNDNQEILMRRRGEIQEEEWDKILEKLGKK